MPRSKAERAEEASGPETRITATPLLPSPEERAKIVSGEGEEEEDGEGGKVEKGKVEKGEIRDERKDDEEQRKSRDVEEKLDGEKLWKKALQAKADLSDALFRR